MKYKKGDIIRVINCITGDNHLDDFIGLKGEIIRISTVFGTGFPYECKFIINGKERYKNLAEKEVELTKLDFNTKIEELRYKLRRKGINI